MKKIILSVLILILVSILFGQTLKYNIQKPQKLYIGTPFHVLVEIITSEQDSIFAPQIDTLDIFILKDIQTKEKIEKGISTTNIDLTFQAFDTGEFTFPQLEFAVKNADTLQVLQTNEFQLKIHSVIADSTQTIKDIAAPLSVNLGFWDFFFPLLILAAVILGIIFLIRFLKHKPTDESADFVVDDRPPYQIVLEALARLKEEKLPEKGNFLQFYFRISLLLRLFIELQFKVNAVEMTTSEIRNALVMDDFRRKSQIIDFLVFADKVKFAKFLPTMNQCAEAIVWLEGYLQSFRQEKKQITQSNEERQDV